MMDTHDLRVSIVVPVLGEAMSVSYVLRRLPSVHEVIVVGDADGAIQAARSALPGVRVLEQGRAGVGNALATGLAAVTGDVVVLFDADGSTDAAEIPVFVEAIAHGADIVRGSRFLPGGGSLEPDAVRRLLDRTLTGFYNRLFRRRRTDLGCGFVVFRAALIPALGLPDPHAPGGRRWGEGREIGTVLAARLDALEVATQELPTLEQVPVFGEGALRTYAAELRAFSSLLTERRHARRLVREVPELAVVGSLGAEELVDVG